MAILSRADKAIYFPHVRLVGAALEGAILQAQQTAETEAKRPLELVRHTEYLEVPPSLRIPLRYHPIDFSKPISIEVERLFGDAEALSATDYQITPDGVLILKRPAVNITITYWAGLDFSQETPEVRTIKSAVAAILNYQVLAQ